MRDHSKHIELKREEAVAKLIEVGNFQPKTEVVSLHDALGRVTAVDCVSKYDLPNVLNSTMDGIAVRFADFENGCPDVSNWKPGVDYGWANTGTAFPEGFDTEIRIEGVTFDESGQLISIEEVPPAKFDRTKPAGADFKKGQLLVAAHQLLTPAKIAGLATCGYSEVEVIVKPKVAFIPTGDELVMVGQELPAGKCYETNGILLEGKLKMWGAEPIIYPCLPDDWDLIKEAILKACDEADIVALNAGSSKGAKDFNMEILEEIGEVFCHETNHGPGRHTSAALVNGTAVLGLSGPPGGCEITADWYLKPLVEQFLYGREVGFTKVTGKLTKSMAGGHGGPGGPGGKPQGGPGGPGGKPQGGPGGPGGKPGMGPGGQGPSKDFFAIKPMHVDYTPEGAVITPVEGKAMHLNVLELDEANAYLCAFPPKFRDMTEGTEVEVELRYPYTAE